MQLGRIEESDPRFGDQVMTYDFLNRLTSATQSQPAAPEPFVQDSGTWTGYGVKNFSYADNGNILQRSRPITTGPSTDEMVYSYDPNRIHTVTEIKVGDSPVFTAQYDENGSMKGFMAEIIGRTCIYLALLVILIWVPFRIIKPYLAERHIRTLPDSVSGQLQKTIETDYDILIKRAINAVQWDGKNGDYYYRLGMIFMECLNKADYEAIGRNRALISQLFPESVTGTDIEVCHGMIEAAFRKAIDLNPVNPFYHYSLGTYFVQNAKRSREARDDQWEYFLEQADSAFDRSLYFFPNSPKLLFNIGKYWFWKSMLLEDPPSKKDAMMKVSHYYEKLIRLDPAYEKDINRVLESL